MKGAVDEERCCVYGLVCLFYSRKSFDKRTAQCANWIVGWFERTAKLPGAKRQVKRD